VRNLSIFGTSSDAGKSTLTFVVGRLLQERGLKVAPFKAQNVSNNAVVADDGSEIAMAQHFQARVLGERSSWHNNPVLLKSGRGSRASLIVKGRSVATPEVREYYREIDALKPAVEEAFETLEGACDCVIAEGAGSPVELNLMQKDLANLYVADRFDTRIVLVADIEKGGVFASIYGVYHLLPQKLRRNVVGVVINKFRGDMRLFDEGVKIIEERFGIPVLGVLPYRPFALGIEDSQSLRALPQDCSRAEQRVAVIAYPTMSNYSDFEPLIADERICVEFINSVKDLSAYDKVVLPGSKLVMQDLHWLRRTGLAAEIRRIEAAKEVEIVGICGGYEMLFRRLHDPDGVESGTPDSMDGLGFIDDEIFFGREKVLCRLGERYEIHHGISAKYPKEYRRGKLYGTFAHGLFADERYAEHMRRSVDDFVAAMSPHLNIGLLYDALR